MQDDAKQPIGAMPGQFRWGVNKLPEALDEPVADGLSAVLLFGVLDVRRRIRSRQLATSSSSSPSPLREAAPPTIGLFFCARLADRQQEGRRRQRGRQGRLSRREGVRRAAHSVPRPPHHDGPVPVRLHGPRPLVSLRVLWAHERHFHWHARVAANSLLLWWLLLPVLLLLQRHHEGGPHDRQRRLHRAPG